MTDTPTLTDDAVSRRQRGFLGFVERVGNLLPEPTMIFVYLIGALMVLSALGDALGWRASLPFSGEEAPDGATLADGVIRYDATSLFSAENVGRLLTEMPRTMSGFSMLPQSCTETNFKIFSAPESMSTSTTATSAS